MAVLLACGAGMTIATTSLTTGIQERAPAAMRGRIMAIWLMAFLGLRPLASALNGLLADGVSLGASPILVLVIAVAQLRVDPSGPWTTRLSDGG